MKIPKARRLASGEYFIQLRLNGVSVPVKGRTEREAKRAAELIKAQHRASVGQARRDYGNPTLADAIDAYIAERSNVLSPATIRGYKTIRRTRFQCVMGRHIKDVKSWQTVVNDEARMVSPKTVKNAWGLVKGVLERNGVSTDVTTPQVPPADREFLQPEEIRPFLDMIRGTNIEMAAILALHGLRRSELLALTKSSVKDGYIRVRGAVVPDETHQYHEKPTNKNKSSARLVPVMIPRLVDLVATCKTDRLVTMHPDGLARRVNSLCRQNGFPEVGLHGLRHTFASLCYSQRLSEMETMRLGGWSDPGTMRKIYTHLAERDKTESERKLVGFFASN